MARLNPGLVWTGPPESIPRPEIGDHAERLRLGLPLVPMAGGGQPPKVFDDGGLDYWGLALPSVVATAVTTVLLAATLACAGNVQVLVANGTEEVLPPPAAPIQDEDVWQNAVRPIPAGNLLVLPYLPDPEELPAGQLAGQPDEDFPPASLGLLVPQTLGLPVAPALPQWQFDIQEPAGALLLPQPDEDFWWNPVLPVQAGNVLVLPLLPDPEEVPAGSLLLPIQDEDFWRTAVPPILVSNILILPYLPDSEALPSQLNFQPDEDVWLASWLPTPGGPQALFPLVVQWAWDTQTSPLDVGTLDEDGWFLLRPAPGFALGVSPFVALWLGIGPSSGGHAGTSDWWWYA